ncbi:MULTISPECIES: D-lyxose/D-mannose family sugar isomerase [unclassified Pseudodesulfovibrio]|uniref:D-lyxose/D-mannose family sugar isomerase n=1 Tax=unclassified Pseudodesulfovibrio TaxID=2661612 RepID=UPI000FEB9EC2|nr:MULTISPECIES: D-lyxose/D-mannose family sugar isomerase [unclassified Pseudodesulfovibrio]MCJ2165837.1 D-lyxose/D-mannose family sugar isomerase [Pseudodesulfovibrio sp. S3-i]RWU02727.1 D-lyxose/D-mannose family sugar isomerase [Pseudodesulfovibrio sp. S3]
MKRSQINALISDAKEFYASFKFALPPWAFWGPDDWKGKGDSEVVKNQLGWDLTDYGAGDFEQRGLILFTIRNGNLAAGHPKKYAEKIMIIRENQICPMHFHWAKTEDIINRGGGNLVIELYGSTPAEELGTEPITVSVDGFARTVKPGGKVILTPGESIFLEQGMYHRFYGEPGKGKVLVGEVSSVNDDNTDNRFHQPQARFPEIEEDEAPLHLLCTDYPNYI